MFRVGRLEVRGTMDKAAEFFYMGIVTKGQGAAISGDHRVSTSGLGQIHRSQEDRPCDLLVQ